MKYLQDHGAAQIAGVCLIDQSPRITNDSQWQLGLFGSLTDGQLKDTLGRLREPGEWHGAPVRPGAGTRFLRRTGT